MTIISGDIPDQPLPQHLGHKPVYSIPYQLADGRPSGTDCRYLSIGLAQWGFNEVSVKIMRHTRGRWTRQAEEMPLNRAIDVTLFLAHVLAKSDDGVAHIKPGQFDHQDDELTITYDEHRSAAEIAEFDTFLDQHDKRLKRRLNVLTDALLELRANGKL